MGGQNLLSAKRRFLSGRILDGIMDGSFQIISDRTKHPLRRLVYSILPRLNSTFHRLHSTPLSLSVASFHRTPFSLPCFSIIPGFLGEGNRSFLFWFSNRIRSLWRESQMNCITLYHVQIRLPLKSNVYTGRLVELPDPPQISDKGRKGDVAEWLGRWEGQRSIRCCGSWAWRMVCSNPTSCISSVRAVI